jgi:hypothetical protein
MASKSCTRLRFYATLHINDRCVKSPFDPKGFSTIATTEGVVNDVTPSIELNAGSWMGINSIADITKGKDDSLTVKLGDYCGERYHEANFPSIGQGVHDVFSYGRDNGYWKRIILDCHAE